MGLFDGLIAKVEGAVTSAEVVAAGLYDSAKKEAASGLTTVENAIGLGPANVYAPSISKPSIFNVSPKIDYSSETSSWAQDLQRWKNILASLDKSMNAHDGASDLSSKVRSWNSGDYQNAQSTLAALVTGDKNADYNATKAAYQQAVSSASSLQSEIQGRWNQFSSAGKPTVSDFVKAPFVAVADKSTQAAAAIERAVAPTLTSANNFLTYAPWIAGGLAALYVLSLLPKRRDIY